VNTTGSDWVALKVASAPREAMTTHELGPFDVSTLSTSVQPGVEPAPEVKITGAVLEPPRVVIATVAVPLSLRIIAVILLEIVSGD